MTQEQLNEIWSHIASGKHEGITTPHERIPAEDGKDIMSMMSSDGTARTVYERKDGGPWREVPFISDKSQYL